MSASARPWLPATALRDDWLVGRLSACAQDWTTHWFYGGRSASVKSLSAPLEARLRANAWQTQDGALTAALDGRAQGALAHWMLGLSIGAQKLNQADQELMDRLAASCAADLLHRVAIALGAAPILNPNIDAAIAPTALGFRIGIGSATGLIELHMTRDLAIAARKASLAPSPARPLKDRAAALSRQKLQLAVMVGRAHLPFSDLCSLAPDDIIVLDRGRDAGVGVRIGETLIDADDCVLTASKEGLALQIGASFGGPAQ
ncbi:MAG: FliM/FliN family flagellar motor switch protein [Hyphomonadaceae bacterium]